MSRDTRDAVEEADAVAQVLAAEVQRLCGDMNAPFRKGEHALVLQHLDMLMASPEVEEVAARAMECRAEMEVLDHLGSTLNVLGPDFLTWRLTTPQGRMIGVEGNYALPRPSTVTPNAYQLYEMEHHIEEAWGQAVLAAMQLMPDEHEHHEEMVSDFEHIFDRCSDYLRALLPETSDAIQVLDVSIADPSELPTQHVVCAAFLKHPPQNVAELATLIEYMKQHSIPLSIAAAELVERVYVRFMKGADAPIVFEQITSVGIIPLSARPFAMLFNNLSDASAVLDAYDLMLDYGVSAEASTLRILCKQSRMEYAKLHFTTLLKNIASADAAAAAAVAAAGDGAVGGAGRVQPTPSPPPSAAPHSPNLGPHRATSGSPGAEPNSSAAAAAAAAAHAASRRRDERSYFAQRIEDLVRKDAAAPLMTALKVVHRAEVEGTSLLGDTYILTALLRHYCRGTTPRSHLVHPFTNSLAYRPGVITIDPELAAAAGTGAEGADASRVEGELEEGSGGLAKIFHPSPAFGGVDSDGGILEELLEEEGETGDSTINDSALPPISARRGEMESERGRRGRHPPHRDLYFADSAEEGVYILEVLQSYGSYPDNTLLQTLSAQYEGKEPEMEIVAKAAEVFFDGCMASEGTMEPVNCRVLHALGYYYIDNRWRDRAHQLLCKVLEMYYAYEVRFHVELAGTERWFGYFAVIVGTKTGSLDLGIGLFTTSLAFGTSAVNPKVPSKLTAKRDSSDHAVEVVEALEKCGWDRTRILCCDSLMLEPQERANAEALAAGGGGDGGVGSMSAAERATAMLLMEDLGKDSIYTSATQGPSSFANAHLLSARPSLATYMYMTLRELGVERTTMNWLRDKLRDARAEALKAHRGN